MSLLPGFGVIMPNRPSVPISRVGDAAVSGTSVTMPAGLAAGDLIIIITESSSGTPPTLLAGYINIGTATTGTSTTARSIRVAYKFAASSSDTSGTWTDATFVGVVVYRGASGPGHVTFHQTTSNSTSTSIPIDSIAVTAATSWVMAAVYVPNLGSTVPTGMTLLTSKMMADTNGPVSSFAGGNFTMLSALLALSATVEILN